MKRLLFLCTGNYYRSRFAEEYFNHFARLHDLEWHADSKGLAQDIHSIGNPGTMSHYAIEHLKAVGITPRQSNRLPETCRASHLLESDRHIALYRPEHEPLVKKRFPQHLTLLEFWDIADVNEASPRHALGRLAKQLDTLIKELVPSKQEQPSRPIHSKRSAPQPLHISPSQATHSSPRDLIAFNGTITPIQDIHISPLSPGFRYGYGLFETVKIAEGRPYYFKEHWERLRRGSEQLGMALHHDPTAIQKQCIELAQIKAVDSGAARITHCKNETSADLLITVEPQRYTPEQYHRGFKVNIAATLRNPSAMVLNFKTLNYLENILARENAKHHGYDEALFLNTSGHICEGAASNIFFAKDGTLYTPSLKCGLLPGILRAKIIDLAIHLQLPLNTGVYPLDILYEADEIFLTNSIFSIMPVCQLNHQPFPITQNPLTQQLMKALQQRENTAPSHTIRQS